MASKSIVVEDGMVLKVVVVGVMAMGRTLEE